MDKSAEYIGSYDNTRLELLKVPFVSIANAHAFAVLQVVSGLANVTIRQVIREIMVRLFRTHLIRMPFPYAVASSYLR